MSTKTLIITEKVFKEIEEIRKREQAFNVKTKRDHPSKRIVDLRFPDVMIPWLIQYYIQNEQWQNYRGTPKYQSDKEWKEVEKNNQKKDRIIRIRELGDVR